MSPNKKLGVTDGKLAPMPKSPNAVSSQTSHSAKRVEALSMLGSRQETMEKIVSCLTSMSSNSIKSQTENYLHTVFVSTIMRFKDDVEFYIDEAQQQVHFRSASRVGHSDLGANRKRYNAFKTLYSAL